MFSSSVDPPPIAAAPATVSFPPPLTHGRPPESNSQPPAPPTPPPSVPFHGRITPAQSAMCIGSAAVLPADPLTTFIELLLDSRCPRLGSLLPSAPGTDYPRHFDRQNYRCLHSSASSRPTRLFQHQTSRPTSSRCGCRGRRSTLL